MDYKINKSLSQDFKIKNKLLQNQQISPKEKRYLALKAGLEKKL
jgi:hypothetical protein